MARLFSIKPAITMRGRRFRGVRGWAGKPSHPPFTDFPIVSYVFAAAFDLISFFTWDHIFVRGFVPAGQGRVGVVRANHGASDHRPVWAVVVPEAVVSYGLAKVAGTR